MLVNSPSVELLTSIGCIPDILDFKQSEAGRMLGPMGERTPVNFAGQAEADPVVRARNDGAIYATVVRKLRSETTLGWIA